MSIMQLVVHLKKMVHRNLLVCVNGFCESCHFDESIWKVSNTIDKELFAGRATFLCLSFLVIFVDCFYNKNAISWHGNAYIHGMLSWMFIGNHMNQLCFL